MVYSAVGMIAAGLLLWLVTGLPNRIPTAPISPIMVSVAQPKTIRVMVDSPRELLRAKVTISLSPDLEVVGFAESREITWQADLHKGRNILKLPIVATRSGSGQVKATIAHGHKEKSLTLELQATNNQLSSDPVMARHAV